MFAQQKGGTITFLSGDTISAPGVNWNQSRHVSCQFPKYIYKYSQHKEVLAWDSFPTNSTGISSSSCGDSYNDVNLKDSPNNKRYMITLGDPSYYDNTTDQHLEERSTNCEFTNLDNQSGIRSTLSSVDRFDAFETVLQNSENSYVPVWDSYYLRFDYVSPTAGGTNKEAIESLDVFITPTKFFSIKVTKLKQSQLSTVSPSSIRCSSILIWALNNTQIHKIL